jgi:hypothetical protein
VVTVPLFALGWALLASRDPFPLGVLGALWNAAVLGVGPLLVAFAAARGWGRTQEWRSTAAR